MGTSKNCAGSGWMISAPFVSKNTPICCWTGSVIALKARMSLLTMRQILRAQDGTQSLETFLRAVPEGTPILITGHSLGGCLASVLAPCVADWRGSTSSLAVYTIAAPSPGNADFAVYYNALFTDPSGP